MSDDDLGQQELDQMPVVTTAATFSSQSLGNGSLQFQQSDESAGGFGLSGGSLMQSSPPPHSYRHSRAYRHFKNPPQPHMCIRTTSDAGEELFINVLSWTRIVIPQEPSDPIPLYGGMRVPPGSPRSPPIVFAVMANPEVLKDSGRHSKDPEERRAMIELMCDFVEAMNPGVKLIRNAIILKDRDISGELKDVWNAVQAQRDREREEQMIQQRQQQHFHNITTQQMFPKTSDQEETSPPPEQEFQQETQETSSSSSSPKTSSQNEIKIFNTECTTNGDLVFKINASNSSNNYESIECVDSSSNANASIENNGHETVNGIKEIVETINNHEHEKDLKNIAIEGNKHGSSTQKSTPTIVNTEISNNKPPTTPSKTSSSTTATPLNSNNCQKQTATPNQNSNIAATPTPIATPPPKKEKLGGFLPNGCIFPRFKNNKHKDKDKDKDKDSKTNSKDKEKNLLYSLKKSKDKKSDNHNHQQQQQQQNDESKSQYEKNCINLEKEVEKLDLNKIDSSDSNDHMYIKVKVAATSAAK